MKLIKLMLFVCLFSLSTAAFAQNIEKTLEKPFQKWSQEEAMKVISAQPWADQFQSEKGLTGVSIMQQGREQSNTRIAGSDTRVTGQERGSISRVLQPPPIVIRLHSALPVRQAMVRLRQIQSGYDKMNEDDRKKFDESVKILLSCPICKDYYVVTLTKFKDSSPGAVDDGIFQTMKFDDLKGKIWLLNDKDEKRELEQFTPPKGSGDSAIFFFKRTDDKGAAFITPETKSFKFVFANELLDNSNQYSTLIPRNFEFRVSKILIDSKVEF